MRREPFQRTGTKRLHLLHAVRKARFSGASPATQAVLARHAEELRELFDPR